MNKYIIHFACALYMAIPLSVQADKINLQKEMAAIASRYNLLSPDCYTAAVHKQDFIAKDKTDRSGHCNKGSTSYDLACLLLGYKKVAWIDRCSWSECTNRFRSYILKGTGRGLIPLLLDQPVNCITISYQISRCSNTNADNHNYEFDDYFLYQPEGRLDALRMLYYCLLNRNLGCDYNNYHNTHLIGICLGYSEEDIEFFVQRGSFHEETGHWLERGDDNIEQFNQYVNTIWALNHAPAFKQAQEDIKNWLSHYSQIDVLEQSIKSYLQTHSDIQVTIDQPLDRALEHSLEMPLQIMNYCTTRIAALINLFK